MISQQQQRKKWALFKKSKGTIGKDKKFNKEDDEKFMPIREEGPFKEYPAKKIIILGSKGCGKTTLSYKYIENILKRDPFIASTSVTNIHEEEDPNNNKKGALDVKMSIRDLRSTEIIKTLKRYLNYAHHRIQSLRTKQLELVKNWEEAKVEKINEKKETLETLKTPSSKDSKYLLSPTPEKQQQQQQEAATPQVKINKLKGQIQEITVQINELELTYRKLKPLYRVLLHSENEHKRLQHLIAAVPDNHQNFIEKHTAKLKCELELLLERKSTLERLETQFDEAVKQREQDRASLEQEWIRKRNEKLDLELLINEEKKKLQKLRSEFKKTIHIIKSVVPEARTRSRKGQHVRQSTRFDNLDVQELKDIRAIFEKGKKPLSINTSSSTEDFSESSNEEFESGQTTPQLIGGFVQNRLSPAIGKPSFAKRPQPKFPREAIKKKYMPTPPVLHLVNAVKLFKENPKECIKNLIAYSIIEDSPKAIAVFLSRCASLSRSTLGEFLGKRGNKAIVEAFAEYHIDKMYINVPFHIAFRAFISTVQLPKEAQMINRIVEAFVDLYVKKQPFDAEIQSADTAMLLGCALLTLNAEIHSGREVRLTKSAFSDMFSTEGVSADYVMEVYDYCVRNKWTPSQTLDDIEDFPVGGTSQTITSAGFTNITPNNTPPKHLSPLGDDRSTRDRKRHRFIHHQRSKSRSMDGTVFYQAPLYFAVTDFSRTSTYTFKIRDMTPVSAVPESSESDNFVLEWTDGHMHHMSTSDYFVVTYAINDEHSYFIAKLIIQYLVRESLSHDVDLANHSSDDMKNSASMSDIAGEMQTELTETTMEELNRIQDRILLVGCKADLEEDRAVSYEKASTFALHYHVPYFEVSSHFDYNVDALYKTIFQYCVRPPSQQLKHTKFDAYEVDTRGMSLSDILNMPSLFIE